MTPRTHGMMLEPDDLSLLGAAFDEAWAAVASDFADTEGPQVARARTELARIMLELMGLRQLDGEELKRTGLRIFRDEKRFAAA
jgi:hypothetical protein